jgi:hypothetical protein
MSDMPTSATAAALQESADGLTFQSETDAPWQAFAWPQAKGEPTASGVKQLGRHRSDAPAGEQSVDEFFAPLVQDQDWFGDEERATAAKYRALLDVIKRSLKTPKVLRIGRRKLTIYIVGAASEGGWAGLRTTAVET